MYDVLPPNFCFSHVVVFLRSPISNDYMPCYIRLQSLTNAITTMADAVNFACLHNLEACVLVQEASF